LLNEDEALITNYTKQGKREAFFNHAHDMDLISSKTFIKNQELTPEQMFLL